MIRRIADAGDPRLAPYARVGDHQWLLANALFVAEGRLVLTRVVDAGRYDIASVLVTPAAYDALRDRLESLAADVYIADQAALNAIAGFNFHRGCLALVRRPAPLPLEHFFDARRLLLLERVGNPDNIGGLFRAAAALEADGILLDRRSADPLYRKAMRTSMGAVLRVPFARVDDWPAALGVLRNCGFRLLALTPEASALALPEVAARFTSTRLALLLGAEGEGLSGEALAAADAHVRIPIAAEIDSLNVAVAAAIALYAFRC